LDNFGRIEWDNLWMTLAIASAQRSIDTSTKHGCVFVGEHNHFISMGYNSYPKDCIESQLPKDRPLKYKVTIHSEINAIINARESLEGVTAYITGHPCSNCFSAMLNAGISKIVYGPVGSHCLQEEDIRLIKDMNISATIFKNKIEIIKFESISKIDNLYSFLDVIKKYINEKVEKTDVMNG
jgi:dCMP deaminase